MLEILREEFGLNYVTRPNIARTKRSAKYPVGTLRDLGEFIINCPEGKVVECDYHALTATNLSSIFQTLKSRGYKFHCVKQGDKRVMWAEVLENAEV